MPKEKITRKQQTTERRAKAAEMIAKKKRDEKRRKIALWSTLGAILVIGAILISFIVVNGSKKMDASENSPNALSTNGVILTSQSEVVKGTGYNLKDGKPVESETLMKDSAVPNIEIFLDYDCPHCKDFEDSASDYLDSLLEAGAATVEYKPIVVIGSNLSISGSNAAACVAEFAPSHFSDAHRALFEKNGQQNVSVSATIKALKIEGEEGEKVKDCMSSKHFSKWVEKASEHAIGLKDEKGNPVVTGTPTILVDGVKYPYDPAQFPTFMDVVLSGSTPEEVITQIDKEGDLTSK